MPNLLSHHTVTVSVERTEGRGDGENRKGRRRKRTLRREESERDQKKGASMKEQEG